MNKQPQARQNANKPADIGVFASVPATRKDDDERPAIVQSKHSRTIIAGQHNTDTPYEGENGTICVFRHIDTGNYYQYNLAFASDPAFVAEYRTPEQVIALVQG